MSRGFASGLLWGGVVSVFGLGAVSLIAPPVAVGPKAGSAPAAVTPEPAAAPKAVPEPEPETVPLPEAAALGAQSAKPKPAKPKPAELKPAELKPTGPEAQVVPPESPPPPGVIPDAPAALSGPGGRNPGSASVIGAGRVSLPVEPPLAKAPPVPGGEPAPAAVELLPPPPLTPEEEALLMPVARDGAEPAPAQIAPDLPDLQPAPAEPPMQVPMLPALPTSPAPEQGVPEAPGGLPRGGEQAFVAPPADPQPARGTVALVRPEAAPVRAFARPFANPEAKPVFVVLLVDTGGADLDRARLAALPFPVTFVIDPARDDAAAAESIYRAAGQEVVILVQGLGPDSKDADLQRILGAGQARLPQAVAVADLSQADQGFQDSRPLAARVVPVIGAQGRGLVTLDRGRNPADQVARREGVPRARIFRQLDGEGEGGELIRRYLDRAAFRAAREGQVAVVGETRSETVQALLEWVIEGRDAQVAMAPLTAMMAGH